MITIHPTPSTFHFASTVESHGWYLLAPYRWDRKLRTLRRAEVLDGASVDLQIRHDGKQLAIDSKRLSKKQREELATRLERMFQLHLDLTEFITLCEPSPLHKQAAKKGFGRLLCGSTAFEDLVKIILTTNTTWKQTVRMCELLVERCGRRSPGGAAAFPLPSDIIPIDPDALQEQCRLGYRAKFIHDLARGFESGTFNIAAISDPAQSTQDLASSYRTLPGIGPYGAAHLLAMDGRHDFIAIDTEFRRFVRETYHGGRDVKESTMLNHYKRWGKWKYLGYWAELWESVREPVARG